MKSSQTILLLSILIFGGCKGCDHLKEFDEQASTYAINDKRIDQKEYEDLIKTIRQSDNKDFQQFKDGNGKVDNAKVVAYLLKRFRTNRLKLVADDIWQPESPDATDKSFNVNVFLENSGSMNGYLNDASTQFKNSVYSLLTRLKLFVGKDSLNLFLINKDDQLMYKNASNGDVENFKNILNPTSFANISRNKTGESDLNALIGRCVKKSNENNLSVFISDCIYSPGRTHPDATQYLAEEKQGIFLNFATELKSRDLAVLVLQIYANFKGKYWNRYNDSVSIPVAIQRPFYIWFIGSFEQIGKIIKSRKLEELDGGYANMAVFQKVTQSKEPNYKILYRPVVGKFDSRELKNKIITDASASKNDQINGAFGFNIAVDFSNNLQAASYYSDATNYQKSNPNYQLKVKAITDKTDASLSSYTHLLTLQTTELKEENPLEVDVIGKMPAWVDSSSSTDDSNISNDSIKNKTFGLRFLMEGVADAFYPKSSPNVLHSIIVTIKK